ncbi:MAG: glycosyltransferase family 2 protein [Eubacteriales bacterium]
MKLSVVIPAYNEEAILENTVRTLSAALEQMLAAAVFDDYELIFVSDGSTDATPSLLTKAKETYPRLHVCIYSPNRGKGCAVRTGVCASKGDYVLYTDCDLAYGTAVIASSVRQLRETDADILIGSRAIHPDGYAGYTRLRRFASVFYLRFLSIAAGFRHSDSQAGFKAMKGDIGRRIFAQCSTDSFAFDFELLMRAQKAGCSFTEMPIRIVNHRASSVHIVRDSIRMLRDIARIRKNIRS